MQIIKISVFFVAFGPGPRPGLKVKAEVRDIQGVKKGCLLIEDQVASPYFETKGEFLDQAKFVIPFFYGFTPEMNKEIFNQISRLELPE